MVGSTKTYEGGTVHDILQIINHPLFNLRTYDFDAAILIMKKTIIFDDRTTQLILLPNANDPIPENTAVLASGWGETQSFEEGEFG